MKRKTCPFPGCTGGCVQCANATRAEKKALKELRTMTARKYVEAPYVITDKDGHFWSGVDWDDDLRWAARWTNVKSASSIIGKVAKEWPGRLPITVEKWRKTGR